MLSQVNNGYRLIGQILFYFALRRKQPGLHSLEPHSSEPLLTALRPFWDNVRRYDYEALFRPDRLDEIIPLPAVADQALRLLIRQLIAYDWSSLRADVLGSVFEQLIPQDEQMLLGQFYTPIPVADLIVAFTMNGARPLVLDPGCGSGTFLMRAYDCLAARGRLSHQQLLSIIWGFDISPFATELAAINLYRQNLSEFNNFPRIVPGDFFLRTPGERVEFPPPHVSGPRKTQIPIPHFDVVIGNPPYLRSQNQDDLDPAYKTRLFTTAARVGYEPAAKTDLFAFFIYHALPFMKPGARIGFVTSASWLMADFAAPLQHVLLKELRLIAVVSSLAESFFSQVDVNTTLIIAEKRDHKSPPEDEKIRFVMLKRRISELASDINNYWLN